MEGLIPVGAIATLVAVDAEHSNHNVPNTMGVYNYDRDTGDAELWIFKDEDRDADGSLRIDHEARKISVYGPSRENMHNANNVASMLGWKTCQLFAASPEDEEGMLQQMVNVTVLNAPPAADGGRQSGARTAAPNRPAVETPPTSSDAAPSFPPPPDDTPAGVANVVGTIEERVRAEQAVVELEEELASRDNTIAQLRERIDVLERDNQALRSSTSATPGDRSHELVKALLGAAQDHIAERLANELVTKDPLLLALRDHGYTLRVRFESAAGA